MAGYFLAADDVPGWPNLVALAVFLAFLGFLGWAFFR